MALPLTYDAGAEQRRRLGILRLVDPKIALASLVPFAVGLALAHAVGARLEPILLAAAYAAILAIEVGKNALNDLYDFRSGADTALRDDERTPFSGGKRVLVDGLLSEGELVAIAFMAFATALGLGAYVALRAGLWVLAWGAAAALVAALYSMPPAALSYRGLGELAVLLVYGPGIVLGTVLLSAGVVTEAAAIASLVLGALIANVLLVNEFPDERADRGAGKSTLVVRLGAARAVRLSALLSLAAYGIAVAAWSKEPRLLAALLGAPFSLVALSHLLDTSRESRTKASAFTLLAYVGTGLALVLSFSF